MPVLLEDEDQLQWRYLGTAFDPGAHTEAEPWATWAKDQEPEAVLKAGVWMHEIQLGLRLAGVSLGSVTRTGWVSCS